MQKTKKDRKEKKPKTKRRQPTTRITTSVKQDVGRIQSLRGSSIVNVRVGGIAPANPVAARPSYIPFQSTQFIPYQQPVANVTGLSLSDIQRELLAIRSGLTKAETPIAVARTDAAEVASARTPVVIPSAAPVTTSMAKVSDEEDEILPMTGSPIEVFRAPMSRREEKENVFTPMFADIKGSANEIDLPGPDSVIGHDFSNRTTTLNPRSFMFTEASSSRVNPFTDAERLFNARKGTIQSIEDLAASVAAPPAKVENLVKEPEQAAADEARTTKPLDDVVNDARGTVSKAEAKAFDDFLNKADRSRPQRIEGFIPQINDKIPIAEQPNYFASLENAIIFNFFKDYVKGVNLKKNIPYNAIYGRGEGDGEELIAGIVTQLNDKAGKGAGQQFVRAFEDFIFNGDNYDRLEAKKPGLGEMLNMHLRIGETTADLGGGETAPPQATPIVQAGPSTGFEPVAKKQVTLVEEPQTIPKPKPTKGRKSKQDSFNAKAPPLVSFPGFRSESSRLGL